MDKNTVLELINKGIVTHTMMFDSEGELYENISEMGEDEFRYRFITMIGVDIAGGGDTPEPTPEPSNEYTFTINATPSEATVVINGTEQSSVTLEEGSLVEWEVSCEGYETQSGSLTLTEDTTIDVTLIEEGTSTEYTLIINAYPEEATVTMNGVEISAGKFAEGTEVEWEVSLEGYTTQSGTVTMTDDITLDITLEEEAATEYTLTINTTPEDAVVTMNGVEMSTGTFTEGTEVEWEVSLEGYTTQSGTVTMTEDITLDITLEEETKYFTLTINTTPEDAIVTMNGVEQHTGIYEEGVEVIWDVSLEGYMSQSGTATMTEDITLDIVLEADGVTRVSTYEALAEAFAEGAAVIEVTSSIDLPEMLEVTSDCQLVIDEGVTLSRAEMSAVANDAVLHVQGGNLVIDSKGTIQSHGEEVDMGVMCIWLNGGTVTINSGTFKGAAWNVDEVSDTSATIYCYLGFCYINGGEFYGSTLGEDRSLKGTTYVLNCQDSNYKSGLANIYVSGGTFYGGFDPADNLAEGSGTNFVTEGHKSVEIEEGVFEVVEE